MRQGRAWSHPVYECISTLYSIYCQAMMAGLVVYYLLEVSPGTTKHKCVMYVKQNKDLNCGFGSCGKNNRK